MNQDQYYEIMGKLTAIGCLLAIVGAFAYDCGFHCGGVVTSLVGVAAVSYAHWKG